jgi:SAM-dependent methyltransferase
MGYPAVDGERPDQLLARLFAEQARRGADPYLAEHGRPETVRHHADVFAWYRPHLPPSGVFLDWGCHYGPDSCLLRQAYGDTAELHACDFYPESDFAAFRAYARPAYRRLTHPSRLPYPDAAFDAVVGSGVLEHTAMDYESLKEVHRVLRPDGVFVITYLPYFLSWDEWYRRRVLRRGFHLRLYGRGELSQLLKRAGFYPPELRFHTHLPRRDGAGPLRRAKRLASRLLSPPFRHSTLCCVARKMSGM